MHPKVYVNVRYNIKVQKKSNAHFLVRQHRALALELVILLTQRPECWDFRPVSAHLDLFLILASPASHTFIFLFLKDRGTRSIYVYKYVSV